MIKQSIWTNSALFDYFFEGCMGSAFKQIGNAVPVLLAECVANGIKKQITSFKKKRE
jgi:DNA (cytosine-5)-methyltransferase 1